MYTKLLSAIAIIEIMWGTIFSVLCVLKMTLADIKISGKLGGIGGGQEANLAQRHYARCGILYIVFGSLLQIYMVFAGDITRVSFWIATAIVVIIPSVFAVWSTRRYLNQLKNDIKH